MDVSFVLTTYTFGLQSMYLNVSPNISTSFTLVAGLCSISFISIFIRIILLGLL